MLRTVGDLYQWIEWYLKKLWRRIILPSQCPKCGSHWTTQTDYWIMDPVVVTYHRCKFCGNDWSQS